MPPWSRIGSIALMLAVATACTEYSAGDRDDLDTDGQDTGDTGDTAPTDDPDDAPPRPSWIQVDGSLVIAGGVPDPLNSTIAIEYRVDPADESESPDTSGSATGGATTLPCTRAPAIVSFTATTAPETAIRLGWWELSLDAAADPSCDFALPTGLHLGLGDLDTQLYAAMDLDGYATTGSSLIGLYARIGGDGAPAWVYGVAGTAAQYAGTAGPVTSPPLPDGTYDLHALHLLPFSPAP